MPFIALALDASNDLTTAPNLGGWIITAVSMPGNFTSMVKSWVPSVLARLS